LIYIPFAGSGSEIISCINNNRNWIATETNIIYINEVIIPRIENLNNNIK
jgi:DNA modification methylase